MMVDFLLSPEGAKIVSMVFLGLIVLVYAARFGLPATMRADLLSRLRRKTEAIRGRL